MVFLLCVLIYVCIFSYILMLINWFVHISMNNDYVEVGDTKYFITYRQFKKLLSMNEGNFQEGEGIFTHTLMGTNLYVNTSSVMRINDKYYYLITPFQLFLANCLICKYTKNKNKNKRKYKYSFFKI